MLVAMKFLAADRRWAGNLAVIMAPGPSLSDETAQLCRGHPTIVVNDACRIAPWADALYACDLAWWNARGGCGNFKGEKWTSHSISPPNDKRRMVWGLKVIEGRDGEGFSLDPARIHYGNNSGFQAVNLAILFGADPIVLVGFDMRDVDGKGHFFGGHKVPLNDHRPFATWIARFDRAATLLGGSPRIINATPGSALTSFEMAPLADALRPAGRAVPAMAASDPRWGGALVQYR